MHRNFLLLLALVSVLVDGQHPGTMLHKHNLPGEKSICNDGTRATYYTQDGLASGSVVIGLQGGGACHDIAECTRRWGEERASGLPCRRKTLPSTIGTRCGSHTAAVMSTRATESPPPRRQTCTSTGRT